MDAREKAIKDIKASGIDTADELLGLPSLIAYFREKFENEPGRLVAKKECPCGGKWGIVVSPGCQCNHTGIIKRSMTRKEVEELAYTMLQKTASYNWTLPTGERVSVEEK